MGQCYAHSDQYKFHIDRMAFGYCSETISDSDIERSVVEGLQKIKEAFLSEAEMRNTERDQTRENLLHIEHETDGLRKKIRADIDDMKRLKQELKKLFQTSEAEAKNIFQQVGKMESETEQIKFVRRKSLNESEEKIASLRLKVQSLKQTL